MATNKYSNESMLYGANDRIPYNLRGPSMVKDDLMNSVGLYSKQDIQYARFNKYSRFGRVLDPYGRVNPGREYLFFVKPDLHICVPSGSDGSIYSYSGVSMANAYQANGLRLNPQLDNNPYFRDLIDTHPNVIKELQYSAVTGNDPFGHLLSFSVNSSLQLDSSNARTLDNPATMYGTTYNYLMDSAGSDQGYEGISLEFIDDKDLDVYHFFKAYSEYHIARKSGLVTPPDTSYYTYKRLHNTMGCYKFIVAEDMETIIYYAYLWGLFPTSCPREAFSDPNFSDGLTFSVSFEAAFIEDMNPMVLYQFNKLMLNGALANVNKNNWLPVIKQNRQTDYYQGRNHSYDKNIGYGAPDQVIGGMHYKIGSTDQIDGTLPRGALVDGRSINGEAKRKYRLRWYA